MRFVKLFVLTAGCYAAFASIAMHSGDASNTAQYDPFLQNKRIGCSVNLGNALEAPREGAWGVELKEEFFQLIKNAGFNSVRIPVRWSAHALENEPYTIDTEWFQRVDWAVNQSLKIGLAVVVNIHHYNELFENPEPHRKRLLGLWRQIALHYMDYPNQLMFELLNEPHANLKAPLWNEMLAELIVEIRGSNPGRTLVIGPADWNSIDGLDDLEIPTDERNVIVTFHYYNPFKFTHQGASWVNDPNADSWVGTSWMGTEEEKRALIRDFDTAAAWGKKHNRPLFLGEFGAYNKADLESRARWTAFVAQTAKERSMSYAYWEFCAGFGLYDRNANRWIDPLLNALIPQKP